MGNENRFTSTERDLELREEIRRKRAKDGADLAEAKRLNAETARILRRAAITVSIAGIFIVIALIIAIVRAVR